MAKLLSLKIEELSPHPKNMRKFYPKDQVQEMANSIAANEGVLEPLIITKGPAGEWLVVDGNMRLAGGRLLGSKCPPLDCKVVKKNEAEQALVMITANNIRYDVDPVSEALHYQSLKKTGMSVRDISKATGVYEVRIHNRLALVDLGPEIQQLIVDKQLPGDHRAAAALMELAPKLRLKVAKRFASNPNTTIKTVLKACENLSGKEKPKKKLKHPATEIVFDSASEMKGKAGDIRKAMQKTCTACTNYDAIQGKAKEPAWALVVHAANDTCNGCSLKEIQKMCGQCPAVALLRKLAAGAK